MKTYAEEVRRSHGAVVKIRVGLNSGEVVVRAIGSDLHMDYTAVGQTTHLAARMEQLADPGAIVITPETLALAEGYVEVKSLGPVPVKGLADAGGGLRADGGGHGADAPAGRRRAAGLTRFVGRDAEVEQLRRVLRPGRRRPRPGGRHRRRGRGGQVAARLRVHPLASGAGLADPGGLVGLLRQGHQLPAGDRPAQGLLQDRRPGRSPRDARQGDWGGCWAWTARSSRCCPRCSRCSTCRSRTPAWQSLDPPQRRQRTLDAVKRLLLRESQVQPLLVVFEDLHWIDGETQALLDSLVESLGSARLLLLVNYRPEYEHRWGSKTAYSQLRLDALPAESAAELLAALLGAGPRAGAARRRCWSSAGNPFFLEETVRTLVETGALAGERGRVPADAAGGGDPGAGHGAGDPGGAHRPAAAGGQAAPAGGLGDRQGRAVRAAAAIAELPEEALRRGLEHLQAAEFLYETRLFPDLEYTFKHALTHEVTYGGLLQERRRELHARIVGGHRDAAPRSPRRAVERLAHHAVRGELWEKAVHYLRQAGLKAAARSALQDARAWFEQALGVLEALPESPSTLEQAFEIRLELRPVLRPAR